MKTNNSQNHILERLFNRLVRQTANTPHHESSVRLYHEVKQALETTQTPKSPGSLEALARRENQRN